MASLFAMCFRPKSVEEVIEQAAGLENKLVSSPLKRTHSWITVKSQCKKGAVREAWLLVALDHIVGLRF